LAITAVSEFRQNCEIVNIFVDREQFRMLC